MPLTPATTATTIKNRIGASFSESALSELVGKLLDDPVRQRVRHRQDVVVDRVERADIRIPVLRQPGDDFVRRRGEMRVHHRRRASPAASWGWPGSGNPRSLQRCGATAGVGLLLRRLVAGFRRLDQIHGDRDVLFQQLVSFAPAG